MKLFFKRPSTDRKATAKMKNLMKTRQKMRQKMFSSFLVYNKSNKLKFSLQLTPSLNNDIFIEHPTEENWPKYLFDFDCLKSQIFSKSMKFSYRFFNLFSNHMLGRKRA